MTNRLTTFIPNNFTCVQWNGRGLTKARLEEFRRFLSLVKPDLVLLSETHWKPYYNVSFKSYHILKKDRPISPGGGVAILIQKNLRFSSIKLTLPDTVEAIGVSIMTPANRPIDFISAYVPKGDCEATNIS